MPAAVKSTRALSLPSDPLDGVAEDLLVGGVGVGFVVVAVGVGYDACLGVVDGPESGVSVRAFAIGFVADQDGLLLPFEEIEVVALVLNGEGFRDSFEQGVVGGAGAVGLHFPLSVTFGFAPDETLVVALPWVRPGGGVKEDDPLPCIREIVERFLKFRRAPLIVISRKNEDIGLWKESKSFLKIQRGGYV